MDCKSIMCDANRHYEAYLKTIKGSKWKETTQRYALNYLRNIFKLIEELEDQSYYPGEEGAFVLNERGKIRAITTLQVRDREVRHVLCDDILMPEVMKKIIYDNGASVKGRGIGHAKSRFETHVHKAFEEFGTNMIYGLFGDFSKFYDNVIHFIAKAQLLNLFEYDWYLDWLLTVIFKNFEVDVSYMTDEEFESCLIGIFNSLEHRKLPKNLKTGDKFMEKSVNIGDQLSQVVGIFYPTRIDTYVKYVLGEKYYGRYMDDFYIISDSKEHLKTVLDGIIKISEGLGIHMNLKKTRITRLDKTNKFLQTKYNLTETGHLVRRINPTRVTKMRKKIKDLHKKWTLGESEYEPIEEMFRSWMGAFYKFMSRDQRNEMIKLFEDLFDKRISFHKKSSKWKMVITSSC